ncbi:hypothetical protein GSI_14337 [Ganoderma sinense ZZ0214-1]|uniref:Uncharacterized protein n=1 Tax=Ganoderma sinense ZZ0214-1 TaxID=1077348 RepID=A0A2G8RNF8_9APHY|nr:hypothetical protein GSI_14337 [Ganoderma sinense ZZ0214-1]
MRSVDEFVSAAHTNTYPDTHRVDPSCSTPLDSDALLLCGTLGTISYDNFSEQVSPQPGETSAILWMAAADQHLENDFSSFQPFVQYTGPALFNTPSPPEELLFSPSQWDDASHPNTSSAHSYYTDQATSTPGHPYWAGLNVVAAYPFLNDFWSDSIAGDCANVPMWNDGMAGRGIEQPGYLSVDDSRHVPGSTLFTDHNIDFSPSPRITAHSESYDVYPSPPLTPESRLHGHDHRHPISLPTHCPPAAPPAVNPWKCPHCNYVQGRRRMVDLKRHIATHTKPSDVALWTCCGYPREAARSKGVPDDVIRETSAIYGRVGGCWETFSRRDALQRHLRKQKGRCFGDAYAEWHPGNSNKRDRQTKTRAHAEDSYQWDE